ncbi:helix-turn-helix domain-containing protein [Aliisedimentitalea scapharcae]|uniref:helix-turn-helix domain-containing protein n=1 Tax=Aliisedimentitalea scapharcae TaxID=1524259 RepID=UPI0038731AF2
MTEPARPFTPDQLADRWGCSGETIRAMIRRGELSAFRVGGKLLRIAQATVEEYECGTTESVASKDDLSSCGTKMTGDAAVTVLRHTRQKKPSEKPAT